MRRSKTRRLTLNDTSTPIKDEDQLRCRAPIHSFPSSLPPYFHHPLPLGLLSITLLVVQAQQPNGSGLDVETTVKTEAIKQGETMQHIYKTTQQTEFFHSFVFAISITPLQVHYYTHAEALLTQHGYCVRV